MISENFGSVLALLLFIAVPVALLALSIWGFVSYRRTPKEQVEKRNTRLLLAIVPAAILGLMLVAGICLTALFVMALTHM